MSPTREERAQRIRKTITECESKINYYSKLKECWWRRRLNLFYPGHSNEQIEEWIVRWEKALKFSEFVEESILKEGK